MNKLWICGKVLNNPHFLHIQYFDVENICKRMLTRRKSLDLIDFFTCWKPSRIKRVRGNKVLFSTANAEDQIINSYFHRILWKSQIFTKFALFLTFYAQWHFFVPLLRFWTSYPHFVHFFATGNPHAKNGKKANEINALRRFSTISTALIIY